MDLWTGDRNAQRYFAASQNLRCQLPGYSTSRGLPIGTPTRLRLTISPIFRWLTCPVIGADRGAPYAMC